MLKTACTHMDFLFYRKWFSIFTTNDFFFLFTSVFSLNDLLLVPHTKSTSWNLVTKNTDWSFIGKLLT